MPKSLTNTIEPSKQAVRLMTSPKKFSSFSLPYAYKLLGIESLQPWDFPARNYTPSDFFILRLQRLQKNFDLRSYEKSKELTIDAYCEEAIDPLDSLKIWKGARIQSDRAQGNADYVVSCQTSRLSRSSLSVRC